MKKLLPKILSRNAPCARVFALANIRFLIVCTVCDNTFAGEMHMVEHSRRNWLSDAPEGGGEVIFFWNWRGVLHDYTCKNLSL